MKYYKVILQNFLEICQTSNNHDSLISFSFLNCNKKKTYLKPIPYNVNNVKITGHEFLRH